MAGAVASFASSVIYVLFALSAHRLILLGEFKMPTTVDARAPLFFLAMLGETVLIGAVVLAIVSPSLWLAGGGSSLMFYPALAFLVIAGFVVGVHIDARLIVLLPHIAVTPPNSF